MGKQSCESRSQLQGNMHLHTVRHTKLCIRLRMILSIEHRPNHQSSHSQSSKEAKDMVRVLVSLLATPRSSTIPRSTIPSTTAHAAMMTPASASLPRQHCHQLLFQFSQVKEESESYSTRLAAFRAEPSHGNDHSSSFPNLRESQSPHDGPQSTGSYPSVTSYEAAIPFNVEWIGLSSSLPLCVAWD